jgi:hypothetical protein
VVEGARLESVCRGNSTVGSNPTLSARLRRLRRRRLGQRSALAMLDSAAQRRLSRRSRAATKSDVKVIDFAACGGGVWASAPRWPCWTAPLSEGCPDEVAQRQSRTLDILHNAHYIIRSQWPTISVSSSS